MELQDNPKARLLARVMRDLSEDHCCAQWPVGCEYALWADLTGSVVNRRKGWGISEEDKEELRILHELAGGWVISTDDAPYYRFLTTDQWLAHLAALEKELH
jgi:hypothetical protein